MFLELKIINSKNIGTVPSLTQGVYSFKLSRGHRGIVRKESKSPVELFLTRYPGVEFKNLKSSHPLGVLKVQNLLKLLLCARTSLNNVCRQRARHQTWFGDF